MLLLLRDGTFESQMFEKVLEETNLSIEGPLGCMLFQNKSRFRTYLYRMLIGLPVWYVMELCHTCQLGTTLPNNMGLPDGSIEPCIVHHVLLLIWA